LNWDCNGSGGKVAGSETFFDQSDEGWPFNKRSLNGSIFCTCFWHCGMTTMTDDQRLTALFAEHCDFVWRTLRRLGVHKDAIEDASQEVFIVVRRKLDVIDTGKERAFLFGVAAKVAAGTRRTSRRKPWNTASHEPDSEHRAVAGTPNPAELLDQERARAALDRIISDMPADVGPFFVSYELERMTMQEIASALDIPPGTVASRLRRARDMFLQATQKLNAGSHG
jgi:RNA polymerase sigma-70 factor, ECF subfamily